MKIITQCDECSYTRKGNAMTTKFNLGEEVFIKVKITDISVEPEKYIEKNTTKRDYNKPIITYRLGVLDEQGEIIDYIFRKEEDIYAY